MRAMGLAVLTATLSLAVQPAPPAGARLVVVIDGDAPAADPRASAATRATLLERLDRDAVAQYYELDARGLRDVPPAEAAEVRRTVYSVGPPRYSGLAITFAESLEVLRGNEAVRDALIARGCGAARSCGGVVHAAAEAEVRRVEASSARKLAAFAANASRWRGGTVLLVTSGWPTRDDARVGVRQALARLRRADLRLVVAQVPPREPFGGLVNDAAASLATQLPAAVTALATTDDLDALVALIAPGASTIDVPTAERTEHLAPTVTAVPAPAAPVPTSAPPANSAEPDATPASPLDATLQRAAAYVDRFEQTFTSVVWQERYQQEDRVQRRFNASGAVTWVVAARRVLDSELFFLWLPDDRTWISVRDVTAVDGKVRPVGDRRLAALGAQSTVTLPQLRALAAENARFNIGAIARTFNEPTLPLLFLDERHRSGVRFERTGTRRADRRQVATYAFVERQRPTVIRSADQDVPASGTLDIDETSGEILRTVLDVAGSEGRLTGRMTVDYRPHPAFDVLVPIEMREDYAFRDREQITAVASYSNFRRFKTAARLILTP